MLDRHIDSGVRRLLVDVTSASDDMGVAHAFARREYAFEGIVEEDVDATTLDRHGLYIVCTIVSPREFIEQLGLISNKHVVQFSSRLTTQMRKDALRRHVCGAHCVQVLYRFRQLYRPRKVTFVPATGNDPRDPMDETIELRQNMNKLDREQRKRVHQCGREMESSVRR